MLFVWNNYLIILLPKSPLAFFFFGGARKIKVDLWCHIIWPHVYKIVTAVRNHAVYSTTNIHLLIEYDFSQLT